MSTFTFHFQNSEIVQLKWSPIVKCLSPKRYETRYKGDIMSIILIFAVSKSANSNEEEKNSTTAKAYFKKAIL